MSAEWQYLGRSTQADGYEYRVLEYVSDLDRKHFEENPAKTEYTRLAIKDEWMRMEKEFYPLVRKGLSDGTMELWTIVKRISENVRSREPFIAVKED